MAVEVHIENIFPTPLYTSRIDVDAIDISDVICGPNGPENIIMLSNDIQLLHGNKFKKVKDQIDLHMQHFYANVLGYDCDAVRPEMSSSWLVKSLPGQESEWHIHGNSIFSGVLYLECGENSGGLTLSLQSLTDDRQVIQLLQPPIKNKSMYNYKFYHVNPEKGLLIIFPSSLKHKVEKNTSSKERLSIAFNYFLKGKFDQPAAFLELK